MADKALIYLSLKGFSTEFTQNEVYRLKNYGIKVGYGEPNPQLVEYNLKHGRTTFVVISNNHLDRRFDNSMMLDELGRRNLLSKEQ